MHAIVNASAWLTPAMVRLELTGDELVEFKVGDHTDAYINAAFPPPSAPYTAPFDIDEVKAELTREQWPARRRYTVRAWDAGRRLLTLEIIVHGDEGIGGPWAAAARPGDVLVFTGPNGSYRPDPDADWHLMVGDESAQPAIAASLEALPAGAPAVVRLLCDGPDHELELSSPGALDVRWLHRRGGPDDADLLPAAVRNLDFPAGRVHAFVHGEAEETRAIRRHLLADRGVARADLSASPYWRRTMTDEAWRRIKKAWTAEVEQDV